VYQELNEKKPKTPLPKRKIKAIEKAFPID
jgi:hypothetical protein